MDYKAGLKGMESNFNWDTNDLCSDTLFTFTFTLNIWTLLDLVRATADDLVEI